MIGKKSGTISLFLSILFLLSSSYNRRKGVWTERGRIIQGISVKMYEVVSFHTDTFNFNTLKLLK